MIDQNLNFYFYFKENKNLQIFYTKYSHIAHIASVILRKLQCELQHHFGDRFMSSNF